MTTKALIDYPFLLYLSKRELITVQAAELIKDYMRGKGIAGVCGAGPLEPWPGMSGGAGGAPFIHYKPEQRLYPGNLLPGARSIIVLGMGCGRELAYTPDAHPRGRFSVGAVGLDYHIGLRKLMDGLEDMLRKNGYVFECYKSADTGPLPETALAVKAGLGWRGRHGLVINDELGSFFNIGYMITDIELKEFAALIPQEIFSRKGQFCGDCNRCIKACPGAALIQTDTEAAEGVIFDYRKCVSYLTQKKGELSEAERASLGLSLYGCDACQNACDYNKNAYIGKLTDIEYVAPRLDAILELTKAEYDRRYKSTAIYWRGIGVLKRNAATALENWNKFYQYYL
jgi:epoxyqueuosine reductase